MVAGGASVPEIVPTLKPVGRPTKRAFDPATFGDISEEVNCGQGEMMLALAKAVRERRPEAEIENISADITRKGEEWLQKSREEFRKLPENKGKSDAELEEKFEGRRELLEAVAQSRTGGPSRNFIIAGTIVDDRGQPLADVDVEITKYNLEFFNANANGVEALFEGNVRLGHEFAMRVE